MVQAHIWSPAGYVRVDDRFSPCHCLDLHQSKGLIPLYRWQHQNITFLQLMLHHGIVKVSLESNPVSDPQIVSLTYKLCPERSVTDDGEFRAFYLRKSFDEIAAALVADKPAHKQETNRSVSISFRSIHCGIVSFKNIRAVRRIRFGRNDCRIRFCSVVRPVLDTGPATILHAILGTVHSAVSGSVHRLKHFLIAWYHVLAIWDDDTFFPVRLQE